MRLLFDQNIPQPLLKHVTGHELLHACHAGWEDLVNGDLIAAAEAARFDVLVTADQSLRYQQNLLDFAHSRGANPGMAHHHCA